MKLEKKDTKKKILLAANDVLQKLGYEHFTLDKIAQRANVSKGGLLYHFPTKQSIIEGMMDSELREHAAIMDDILNRADRNDALKFLKEDVRTTFEEIASEQNYGIIAAVASNSKIIDRFMEHEKKVMQIIKLINPNFENLLILKLASEGIWFNHLAGIKFLSEEELKQIKNFIIEGLVRETPSISGNEEV